MRRLPRDVDHRIPALPAHRRRTHPAGRDHRRRDWRRTAPLRRRREPGTPRHAPRPPRAPRPYDPATPYRPRSGSAWRPVCVQTPIRHDTVTSSGQRSRARRRSSSAGVTWKALGPISTAARAVAMSHELRNLTGCVASRRKKPARDVSKRSVFAGSTSSRPSGSTKLDQVFGPRDDGDQRTTGREDPVELGRITRGEDAYDHVDHGVGDRVAVARRRRRRRPSARGPGRRAGSPRPRRPGPAPDGRDPRPAAAPRSSRSPRRSPRSSAPPTARRRPARRRWRRSARRQEVRSSGDHLGGVGVGRWRSAAEVQVALARHVEGMTAPAADRSAVAASDCRQSGQTSRSSPMSRATST